MVQQKEQEICQCRLRCSVISRVESVYPLMTAHQLPLRLIAVLTSSRNSQIKLFFFKFDAAIKAGRDKWLPT